MRDWPKNSCRLAQRFGWRILLRRNEHTIKSSKY
jgi:hypothetical protein